MSAAAETRTGGERDQFPQTAWSTILSSPDASSPERRERLNRLCAAYWRPVYRFIRFSWRVPVDTAEELTQEFFCDILERDLVIRYAPERGRFRNYLKAALRTFLAEEYRDRRRLKRGGGRAVLSLDARSVETDDLAAEREGCNPGEIFDRQWARDVVRACLARLKEEMEREGKGDYFRVYQELELSGSASLPTAGDLARSMNLALHDVKNRLAFVRERLRQLVIAVVTEYVTSPEELAEEIQDLFSR